MDNFLVLLALGLGAGVFSGLFGIGGGIVIVPALTLLLAFDTKTAVATSLAALLLPVGIFAVLEYRRKGLLDIRASAWVAFGLVLTTIIGAEITLALPAALFKQAYGVFVIIMGLRFLGVFNRGKPAAPIRDDADTSGTPWWGLFAMGLAAGVLSGMFGIGGGIVIVPALVGFFGFPHKRAVGSSLGALLLPVGLLGVLRYAAAGTLDVLDAAPVAIGLAVGALGGARIAIGLSAAHMKQLYGAFLVVVGIWFVVQPYVGV